MLQAAMKNTIFVDSSHVKNVYGRFGLGRSPVDRGRKWLKVLILTDCNGVMHNIRADPAIVSDCKLFTPMLTSMYSNLRLLEVCVQMVDVVRKQNASRKSTSVSDAEKKLGKHNSRSSCPDKLNAYFKERRLNFGIFYEFYGQFTYRARRWGTFKKDQQSISFLINNFKGMRKKGKTLALAYGSWAKCSTKVPMKGIAPCIGIVLRRRLPKEFVVVAVPEHYTSQTYSKCFGRCDPFHELENVRRKKKLKMYSSVRKRNPFFKQRIVGILSTNKHMISYGEF